MTQMRALMFAVGFQLGDGSSRKDIADQSFMYFMLFLIEPLVWKCRYDICIHVPSGRLGYDFSFDAYWLKLRDEKSCEGTGQWILSNVSRAYGPDSGVSFGELLEKVCEPGIVPSAAARESHRLSVKAFQVAQATHPTQAPKSQNGSLWGELHQKLLDMVNVAQPPRE